MLYNTLLIIHIIAGMAALTAAFVATAAKTINVGHRWHVYAGTVYLWGMVVIFLTAIPMTILKPNPFLFLIAIFSFYLALSGWRFAKNRRGTPRPLDWATASVMAVTSVAMILFGVFLLIRGDSNGITIIVFGGIGAALSFSDLRTLRVGGVKGKTRVANHLTMMLAGTIATTTAFVVTNFTFEPAFLLWLAPTVVISPIIAWWSRRIATGRKPKGMP